MNQVEVEHMMDQARKVPALEDKLEIAASRLAVNDLYVVVLEGLLKTLCEDLEANECTFPPGLLDWWEGYKDRT